MIEASRAQIFGSVNARNLTPAEVAKTFVPPPSFTQLTKHGNAIVVGPRGSGKTTLLKMLHQDALETWKHPDAEEIVGNIRFVSVFIPTDYRWKRQLELLGEGQLPSEVTLRFAMSAYTSHTVRALCSTMIARLEDEYREERLRTHARVALPAEAEEAVSVTLAKEWKVELAIPSLLALRQALSSRLKEIRWAANKLAHAETSDIEDELRQLPFLDMPLVESVALGVEVFNDVVGEPDRKWALAFDELEFAPRPALKELLRALRGAEELLLFKLALAPASGESQELETSLAAAPEQDYEAVQLWYPGKKDGEQFCRRLWEKLAEARDLGPLSAETVLGDSYFDPKPGPSGDDYEADSKWASVFKEMRGRDESFREYLDEHDIDIEHLDSAARTVKTSQIRKVAPALPLREFYLRDFSWEHGGHKRSRQRASLYAGALSFFAISEGNPRWFIGLANRLIDRYDGSKIKAHVQAQEMERTAHRFSAYLKTIPAPTVLHKGSVSGVAAIIEDIAQAIHNDHVKAEFKPEPLSTFLVPAGIPKALKEILQIAINAGAVIYIPEEEDQVIVSSLERKRFRVSWLLAPLYGLPLRVGKPMSLSSVFSKMTPTKSEQAELQLEE